QREVRPVARTALLAYGDEALEFLASSLADEALPHEVRRHLPRTISLFSAAAAATVLEQRLLEEHDGMVRHKMLRALSRLALQPDVTFDAGLLRRATEATMEAAFRLLDWRQVLQQGVSENAARATPGQELLARLLQDKERDALERIFRLLALQF